MRALRALACLLPLLAVVGCAGAADPEPGRGEVAVEQLPGWSGERVAEAIPPLLQACPRLAAAWRLACAEARAVPAGDESAARRFVQRNFRAVPLGRALFTGYFELDLPGSRTRGGAYQVPVLAPPADPRAHDRAGIERGALAGRGLELLWLASPADLFFLQLQGSGRVHLPDGQVVRLGYAASNGRAPVPTERLFAGAGMPGNDLSIPGLRAWVARHPDQAARLSRDPSYVFFRVAPPAPPGDATGHVGALGAPLVPLRSVAVDPAYVPLGSPVWLDTTDSFTGRPLQRLMLAEDTGEAIRGPSRTDIYYGWDRRAEAQGGHMHATGQSWLLQPVAWPRFAGLP